MTTVQRVAQIFGIVFLLVGIIGFFYARGSEMQMLLGIFPVNLLHNCVHLLFGLWGLSAARSFNGAKMYGQWAGVIYLVLAVVGYFDPTGFGLVPLGGADIGLHLVLGLVLAYFGFSAKSMDTTAAA